MIEKMPLSQARRRSAAVAARTRLPCRFFLVLSSLTETLC